MDVLHYYITPSNVSYDGVMSVVITSIDNSTYIFCEKNIIHVIFKFWNGSFRIHSKSWKHVSLLLNAYWGM